MCKIYLLGVFSLLVTNTAFNVVIYPQTYSLGDDWKPGEIEKFSAEDDQMVSADEAGVSDLYPSREDFTDFTFFYARGFAAKPANESVLEEDLVAPQSREGDDNDMHPIAVGREDSASSQGSFSETWKAVG